MSPFSLSKAAQFVCSGCHTMKSKRETSWEPGTAISGSQHQGKRCCHRSLLHLQISLPKRLLLQLPGEQFLQHLTCFFPPLPSLDCVSSLSCQTQVLQKNVSALLPSLNHVAGLKNRGRKGGRKTNTTFWAVVFAFWVFL